MSTCNGQGANGDHCCWINGEVCIYLDTSGPIPRCAIWGHWDGRWHQSPVGRWFAKNYPGYNCGDWPQNIPEVVQTGPYSLCCWSE